MVFGVHVRCTWGFDCSSGFGVLLNHRVVSVLRTVGFGFSVFLVLRHMFAVPLGFWGLMLASVVSPFHYLFVCFLLSHVGNS